MIHGTPMLGKHKSRWPIGNATETIKVLDADPAFPRGPALLAAGMWNCPALAFAWLSGLPRRAGNRLFARNDAEARWRGWQVTELAGGLGRQYRDSRFDTLREQFASHGGPAEQDSHPGARPRPGLGGYVPGVPEAWDDHWNGGEVSSTEDDLSGEH